MIYDCSLSNPLQLFLSASYINNSDTWSIIYDSSSNYIGDIIHMGDWSTVYDLNSIRIGYIKHFQYCSIIYDISCTKIGYIKHKEFLSTVYGLKNNRVIEYRNDNGYSAMLH